MGQKLDRYDAQKMVDGAIVRAAAEYEPTDSAYFGKALKDGKVAAAAQELMNFCFDNAAEGKSPATCNQLQLDRLKKALVSEYTKAVKEQGQPINGQLASGIVHDEIEKPIWQATFAMLGETPTMH